MIKARRNAVYPTDGFRETCCTEQASAPRRELAEKRLSRDSEPWSQLWSWQRAPGGGAVPPAILAFEIERGERG